MPHLHTVSLADPGSKLQQPFLHPPWENPGYGPVVQDVLRKEEDFNGITLNFPSIFIDLKFGLLSYT